MADDSATERHMSKSEAITFLREQSQRIQEQRADIDVAEVLADDPNAKAHAYIRALERQLEEAKGKLATHRTFLVEMIEGAKSGIAELEDGCDQSYSDWLCTRQDAFTIALRALDGDDEAAARKAGEGS